jgi:hypothetical protein
MVQGGNIHSVILSWRGLWSALPLVQAQLTDHRRAREQGQLAQMRPSPPPCSPRVWVSWAAVPACLWACSSWPRSLRAPRECGPGGRVSAPAECMWQGTDLGRTTSLLLNGRGCVTGGRRSTCSSSGLGLILGAWGPTSSLLGRGRSFALDFICSTADKGKREREM